MPFCFPRSARAGVLAAASVLCVQQSASAALMFFNFDESGNTVNGYQDDFEGAALDPGWTEVGGDPAPNFSLSGSGSLLMQPAQNDPNKLLYNPAGGYSNTSQNVLALVRVLVDPAGESDGFRGGVAAVSDPVSGPGHNLHFREPGQNGPGNHFNLLDDGRAWGPNTDPTAGGEGWTDMQYKWLRLVSDGNFVQGKIWDAGTDPEPADFDLTWDAPDPSRTGLAGLVTNSVGGQGVFEVEYVLIQAEGLPQIQVLAVPEPAALGLLGVAGLGLVGRGRRAKSTRR